MHDRIWKPLGLRDTRAPSNGVIQEPALHGYWGGRGVYEDTTFWDPTWARNAGNLTTDLHDLAIWARAIARGTVLTPASHRLQTGNINVGIGHNSPARHYGMGIAVLDGWVLTNPQVPGYNIVQAYQPARKLTVVVVTTLSRRNSSTRHYSTLVFLKLARALTGSAPPLAIDPRPTG
jgi:CubicO group peptidase (beta-lactamase class C family)